MLRILPEQYALTYLARCNRFYVIDRNAYHPQTHGKIMRVSKDHRQLQKERNILQQEMNSINFKMYSHE